MTGGTAGAGHQPRAARDRRRWLGGSARRRLAVLVELVVASSICVLGYRLCSQWVQVHEAGWVAGALQLLGVEEVSGALPGHILIFRPDGDVLNAVVTGSCSALLSVLALTALTVTVLRSRGVHAVAGLAAA